MKRTFVAIVSTIAQGEVTCRIVSSKKEFCSSSFGSTWFYRAYTASTAGTASNDGT
jgi:hypothetical protein